MSKRIPTILCDDAIEADLDADIESFLKGLNIRLNGDLSGPCEDDPVRTAPYLWMTPEESEEEDGSPLKF